MKVESGTSLQQSVGWDRLALRVVRCLADSQDLPFLVCSLSSLARQVRLWKRFLPRVQAYHELSCNNMEEVLKLLDSMDVKFSVVNKKEMIQLVSSGINTDHVIFNNPTKLGSHIRAASSNNINTTTFDSEEELKKIKKNAPESRLLLQLKTGSNTDGGTSSQLGAALGAKECEVENLLVMAHKLGLHVVGASISLSDETASVKNDLELVKRVFDMANKVGADFCHLHLGEVGDVTEEFGHILSDLLDKMFDSVEVTASAGKFLSTPSVTLAAQVIGVRQHNNNNTISYNINEGVFGAFSTNLTGDRLAPVPFPLGGGKNRKGVRSVLYDTMIVGPSGDETDTIIDDIMLPQLNEGDWLLFPNMGHHNTPDMVRLHHGEDFVIYIKSRQVFPDAKPCPGLQNGWAESCTYIQLEPDLDLEEVFGARGEIDLGSTFIYS